MSAGIGTKKYGDNTINPLKLFEDLRRGVGYAYYYGDAQPSLSAPNGYGDPTGTTGDINRAFFPGTFALKSQYHVKGTQTLLGPLLDTTGKGLDVSQDQTADDGVEHVFGALNTRGAFTWTVGTHNAFVRVKFRLEDVSDADEVAVGVRKNEAFQAAIDDYDEAAFFNVISGDVKVETILNGAATVTTDTGENWADDATHELMVRLIGRRATFWYDGAPAAGVPEFNFDADEVVVPFWFHLLDDTGAADGTTKLWWTEVEVGLLKYINTAGISQP